MAALIVFKKVANDGSHNSSNNKRSKAFQSLFHFRRIPEAGGEEEEQLISKLVQVSLETQKFAGRPRHFVSAWMSVTSDQNVLNIVQHCHLEICNLTQPRPRPQIQFDPKERETIT